MKLLNREPTEEMIAATGAQNLATTIWQLMYDAAPGIKMDMEPVAAIKYLEDGEIYILPTNGYLPAVGDLFYSAEQVAAAERDKWLKIVDNYAPKNVKEQS